jgi:GMP synthase-like glutamine amidotransferase
VLVLQSAGQRFPDPLLATLLEHQLIPVVAPADPPAELPDPAGTRFAVLTGSERFADVAGREYLDRQVDWVRQADAEGTTVLGLGHGARVLALAFGGSVDPVAGGHVGVQFHPDATAETLAGWGGAIPVTTARDPRAAEWCSRRLFSGFVEAVY